jgi:opacity protein-like surface antigen
VSHRHYCPLLFMLMFSAVSAFAQSDRRPEFFVGYSNLQAEGFPDRNDPNNFFSNAFLNRRATLHGINLEATLFPLDHVGVTGNISYNRRKRSADVGATSNSEHTDLWYFLGGPSYVFPDQGHLVPFARIMAGAAHTGYEAVIQRTAANGNLTSSFDVGGTDFAMAIGAGLDVRVSDRFKVRVIQVDYAPVFLGDRTVAVLGATGVLQPRTLDGQRQDNLRFSFGVSF